MKKQTKNLSVIGFLLVIIMVGGVFAQSYFKTDGYEPLPLPEYKEPFPDSDYSSGTVEITNPGITPDPVEPVILYFFGSGYMANDNGKGLLVDFKVKAEEYGLAGIVNIDGKTYYIKGSVVGMSESSYGMHADLVEFNIISTKNGNVVGTFKGNLEYYENFKVLKGTLYEFKGRDWSLVAFGRNYDRTPAILIEPAEDTLDSFPTLVKDSKETSIGKAQNY